MTTPAQPDHRARLTKLDHDVAAASHLVERIRLRVNFIRELGEIIMAQNDDLSADLDTLEPLVTTISDVVKTLEKANADLTTQIANGSPGLTADQAAAIATRFAAVTTTLKAAIASATSAPPPAPSQPQSVNDATVSKPAAF